MIFNLEYKYEFKIIHIEHVDFVCFEFRIKYRLHCIMSECSFILIIVY